MDAVLGQEMSEYVVGLMNEYLWFRWGLHYSALLQGVKFLSVQHLKVGFEKKNSYYDISIIIIAMQTGANNVNIQRIYKKIQEFSVLLFNK